MEAQGLPSEEGNAQDVNESLGMDAAPEHEASSQEVKEDKGSNETLAVQKRLKSQKRAHEREVRELHARIGDLESRMAQPMQSSQNASNPAMAPQGDIEQHIHKAVSYALQAKDAEERKARDQESAAHVHRQYQEFQKHLDSLGDKYDDFHDSVLAPHTPYTPAMRDYALTLPRNGSGSAGEVLYKLAKNPDELQRIAKLHPLDQASEMSRMSHALMLGGESKHGSAKPPLGNIKSNPIVNSPGISDKTPISELRAKMKAGWK